MKFGKNMCLMMIHRIKESSERRYRIVVNVIDAPLGREYHILGKYKFDFENSTHKKHILIKSEEI
jgi:hypothetical protein